MFWPWLSSSFMVSRPYRYSHWLFGYLCILAKAKPLLLNFLIAITLTGCLSGPRNVYLLRLQVPGNFMEVCIGYFGIDCHLRDVCSKMSADPALNRNVCQKEVRELYASTRRDSRGSHLKEFCFGRCRPFQPRSRRKSQFAKHDRSSTQHAAKEAPLHPRHGGWSLRIISDCSDASQMEPEKVRELRCYKQKSQVLTSSHRSYLVVRGSRWCCHSRYCGEFISGPICHEWSVPGSNITYSRDRIAGISVGHSIAVYHLRIRSIFYLQDHRCNGKISRLKRTGCWSSSTAAAAATARFLNAEGCLFHWGYPTYIYWRSGSSFVVLVVL